MALPPTLPTDATSPSFAIPTTKVEKTSGEMIIWTSRMKIVVSSLMVFENPAINSCVALT